MESVIDKVILDIGLMAATLESDGGFEESLPLKAVYFGDPGVIPGSLYPCATVEAISNTSDSESTGFDKRDLVVAITLHIDAREFFDSAADEATGDRALVRASFQVEKWFRRRAKRTLDGLQGVNNVSVQGTAYPRPQYRRPVITKSSRTTLLVRKSYARVLD